MFCLRNNTQEMGKLAFLLLGLHKIVLKTLSFSFKAWNRKETDFGKQILISSLNAY